MNQLAVDQTRQKTPARPKSTGLLQRKCACGQHTIAGGECAECKKKRLQRRAAHRVEPATAPPIVHEVLRSAGRPLDVDTRSFMEERFGYNFSQLGVQTTMPQRTQDELTVNESGDKFEQQANRVAEAVLRISQLHAPPQSALQAIPDFSQVRIHTDAKAAESARAVNALAYTMGHDLVFGAGQYAPGTTAGKRLLAHELTHVIQQSGGAMDQSGSAVQQVALPSIQRTTVTVNAGCPGTAADITTAVGDARTGIGRIADPEARECLLDELNDADIVCESDDVCGSTRYIGSTIKIHQWGSGCPSLPALLVHESAHKCKLFFTEEFSEACENEAFGGRGATPPGPGETGGKCEL